MRSDQASVSGWLGDTFYRTALVLLLALALFVHFHMNRYAIHTGERFPIFILHDRWLNTQSLCSFAKDGTTKCRDLINLKSQGTKEITERLKEMGY